MGGSSPQIRSPVAYDDKDSKNPLLNLEEHCREKNQVSTRPPISLIISTLTYITATTHIPVPSLSSMICEEMATEWFS